MRRSTLGRCAGVTVALLSISLISFPSFPSTIGFIRIHKPSIANLRAIVSALPRQLKIGRCRYRRFRGRIKRSPWAAIPLLARSLRRNSQLFMGAAWCSQAKSQRCKAPV